MSIPRYVVVKESPDAPDRTTHDCQACAFQSIPIGQSRILIDAGEGIAWRVWRRTDTTGQLFRVSINHRYEVTNVFGLPMHLTVNVEAHAADHALNEAATVASVERYLKENQDARR